MSYQQTLDWLFAQLPMYQRTGGANYKIDLVKTHQLMELLGNPENGFASIHVAGTNGKGSVSHLMASALQEKGLKVGLYTSPHLLDFRERIKINGEVISEEAVIEFVENNKEAFTRLQLSFFEMTVGMAFHYFKEQKVDIAVIEVGMGGRLDSTNVVTPLVSVITNIGLDHQAFLGNTLPEIAAEKAGIIKNEVLVVIGKTQPETLPVFTIKAKQHQSPMLFADAQPHEGMLADLRGPYQQENIQTAYTALNSLPDIYRPSLEQIKTGFLNTVKNTGLRGRWETLKTKPLTICDTGHNIDGVKLIVKQLEKMDFDQLHMVWGSVNDKDISGILTLLPEKATYYFCQPSIPRALPADALHKQAEAIGLKGSVFLTVKEAIESAKKNASESDLIFIGGSTFVVADALQ